jgi:hypothetical protein
LKSCHQKTILSSSSSSSNSTLDISNQLKSLKDYIAKMRGDVNNSKESESQTLDGISKQSSGENITNLSNENFPKIFSKNEDASPSKGISKIDITKLKQDQNIKVDISSPSKRTSKSEIMNLKQDQKNEMSITSPSKGTSKSEITKQKSPQTKIANVIEINDEVEEEESPKKKSRLTMDSFIVKSPKKISNVESKWTTEKNSNSLVQNEDRNFSQVSPNKSNATGDISTNSPDSKKDSNVPMISMVDRSPSKFKVIKNFKKIYIFHQIAI